MEANVHRYYRLLAKKHERMGFGIMRVEYEPKGFKFRDNDYNIRYYIPDFKISTNQMVWYVEVKGFVDNSARQKAKLVSTQYPGIKIYYVLPKEYNLIKDYYARDIPNWEY